MNGAPHLVLAPLRGVTDSVFRTAYARHFGGFDRALAPFVTTVKGKGVAPSHIRDLEPTRNALLPVAPQALGNNPEDLVNLAETFAAMGYDHMDWNLGCPFAKVTGKRRGSGLLPFPDQVAGILESVVARSPIPLSIKVRLGLHDPGDLQRLLPRIAHLPLHGITIHARTADAMYDGPLDLEAFERCLPLCRWPVCYNGDIADESGFAALRARFGGRVESWMVGRGAIGDPFLPRALKGTPHAADRAARLAAVRAFHDEVYAAVRATLPGTVAVLGRMKELWRILGRWCEPDGRYTGKLCRTTALGTYEAAVKRMWGRAECQV